MTFTYIFGLVLIHILSMHRHLGARVVAKRWSKQLVHRIVYGERHDKYEKEDLVLMMSVLALKRRGLIALYEDEDDEAQHDNSSSTAKISKLKSEMKKHLAAGAVIDHRPAAAIAGVERPLHLAVGSVMGGKDDEVSQCSWTRYKRRKKPHFSDTDDDDDDDNSDVDFVEDMEGSAIGDGDGDGNDGGDSLWMSPSHSSITGGLVAQSGGGLFDTVENDVESGSHGNVGTGVIINDRQQMKLQEAQKRKESLRLQAIAERQKKLKPRVLRHFIDEIDEVNESGDRNGGGDGGD